MAAAMLWPTLATTCGHCKLGWGTRIFSTRCVTPSWARIGLGISGDRSAMDALRAAARRGPPSLTPRRFSLVEFRSGTGRQIRVTLQHGLHSTTNPQGRIALVEAYRDGRWPPRQRLLANLHGEPDTLRALARLIFQRAALRKHRAEQWAGAQSCDDKELVAAFFAQIDADLAALERDIRRETLHGNRRRDPGRHQGTREDLKDA